MTNEDVMIDDSSELCDLALLLVTDVLINHLSVIEINSTHSSPRTGASSCKAHSILQYFFYQIDKDLHLQLYRVSD